MSCRCTRRNFLQGLCGAAGMATFEKLFAPAFVLAQSSRSAGRKRYIQVVLDGGYDVLSALPYTRTSPLSSDLQTVRTTLMVPEGDMRLVHEQTGMANKIAFHRAWDPMLTALGGSMGIALVPSVGHVGTVMVRSHAESMVANSICDPTIGTGRDEGILAKYARMNRLDTLKQFFVESPIPTDTAGEVAFTLGDLGLYRYEALNSVFSEAAEFEALRERLIVETDLPAAGSQVGGRYYDVRKAGSSLISVVQSNYIRQQVGTLEIPSFEAAAKILKATKDDNNVQLYQIRFGGFDTHDGQGSSSGVEGHLMSSIRKVAQDLAQMMLMVRANGLEEDTLWEITSEFARTVRQNNSGGTDHGEGSTAVLFGARVNSTVVSSHPESSTFLDPDYDAIRPLVNIKDVRAEILADFLGDTRYAEYFGQSYRRNTLGLIRL